MKTSLFQTLLVLVAIVVFAGCQQDEIATKYTSPSRPDGMEQAKYDQIIADNPGPKELTVNSRVPINYVATLTNGSFNYTHAVAGDWDYSARATHDYYKIYATAGDNVVVTVYRLSCGMDPGFWLNTGTYTDTDMLPVGIFVDDVIADACGSCWSEPQYAFTPGASGWYTISVMDVLSCSAAPFDYQIVVSGLSNSIVIGACNTTVPNGQHNASTTMQQAIDNCLANSATSAQFVACVTSLTNTWVSQGKITRAQKSKIIVCAQSLPF